MGAMSSQITSPGNSPVTIEFPAQMVSKAEIFPFDDVIMKNHPQQNVGHIVRSSTASGRIYSMVFFIWSTSKTLWRTFEYGNKE